MGARLTRVKIVDGPKPLSPPTVVPPTTTTSVPSPSSGVIQAEITAATPEEAKPAEVPLTWTDLEDATLIGLKALNKTWKEIGAIMTNKPTEDLRERYDELNLKTVKATEAEKKDDEPKAEAKEKNGANATGDHGDKGKGKGVDKKDKEKGKHKNGAKKAAKATVESADSDDSQGEEAKEETVNAKSANITKGKPLKPILKKGKRSQKKAMENDEPTHYQGRPVIFVDDGDALSVGEVGALSFSDLQMLTFGVLADESLPNSSIPREKEMGRTVI